MKIRNGFVSNSSSSSFVAVGYLVPCDEETNDMLSNSDKQILCGCEDGIQDGFYLDGEFWDIDEDTRYGEIEITQDMVGKKIIISTRMC